MKGLSDVSLLSFSRIIMEGRDWLVLTAIYYMAAFYYNIS